ncbi:hypothetical protein GQ43DRAFT_428042 [Delitschia confertaspora ATCC 74209]|uniref:Uncharacterized protein n=1 Tax=Delitschia confertaspora ATCC 74209 TaxID=1513339 RepID=A0A9P4JYB4_9PLEO|nr:hypothetical protein GQ43DRAFT_428042 [Delitschia confertaspora ATCC 74209]
MEGPISNHINTLGVGDAADASTPSDKWDAFTANHADHLAPDSMDDMATSLNSINPAVDMEDDNLQFAMDNLDDLFCDSFPISHFHSAALHTSNDDGIEGKGGIPIFSEDVNPPGFTAGSEPLGAIPIFGEEGDEIVFTKNSIGTTPENFHAYRAQDMIESISGQYVSIYPAYHDFFRSPEEARVYRRQRSQTGTPYIAPASDPTFMDLKANRDRYVRLVYMAMVRGDKAKDNLNSLARKRWVVSQHHLDQDVVAHCHKVIDCLIDQVQHGYKGLPAYDLVNGTSRRKYETADENATCAERFHNIIQALETEKTICEDVMGSTRRTRMFVNAPVGYAKRKEDNRQGNSRRSRAPKSDASEEPPALSPGTSRSAPGSNTLVGRSMMSAAGPSNYPFGDNGQGSPPGSFPFTMSPLDHIPGGDATPAEQMTPACESYSRPEGKGRVASLTVMSPSAFDITSPTGSTSQQFGRMHVGTPTLQPRNRTGSSSFSSICNTRQGVSRYYSRDSFSALPNPTSGQRQSTLRPQVPTPGSLHRQVGTVPRLRKSLFFTTWTPESRVTVQPTDT